MLRASIIGVLVGTVAGASTARAETCNVNGTIDILPMDTYFCDSAHLGSGVCAGWEEVDLDNSTRRPMKHMYVEIDDANKQRVGDWGKTDGSGNYSINIERPSCSGFDFRVRVKFKRIDPNDPNDPPIAGYFRVTGGSTNTVSHLTPEETFGSGSCGSSSCTVDVHFVRNTGLINRWANVYYTANSAIEEVRGWSSGIQSHFTSTSEATDGTGMLRLRYHSSITSSWASGGGWSTDLAYDRFNLGANTRHEIGHLVHAALHDRNQNNSCNRYTHLQSGDGHTEMSCEYGLPATLEGIASFIATRSIVTSGSTADSAFFCWCADSSNQDLCSEYAKSTGALLGTTEVDRSRACMGSGESGWIYGVGDTYASSTSHCTRLDATQPSGTTQHGGCACEDSSPADGVCDEWWNYGASQPCPDSNSDGECDTYTTLGWRNEVQVARFLWDVIDSNNEGSDDTDESMSSLAADFEQITCQSGSGYDTNLTCNEPNRSNYLNCEPAYAIELAGTPMTGTRDSYNVYDLAYKIAGNQSGERALNCVSGASN